MSAERPSNVAKEGHEYVVGRLLGYNRLQPPDCRLLHNKLAVLQYEAGSPLALLLLAAESIMGLPGNPNYIS